MAIAKVVRKGSYQGVPQWGISSSSEGTPSKKTANKWAALENASHKRLHSPKQVTCATEDYLCDEDLSGSMANHVGKHALSPNCHNPKFE